MKPNTENSEKGTTDTIGKVKRVVQKTYGNNNMEVDDKAQEEEKRFFMLHNAKVLKGYKLNSLDGEIGRVKEFYFDDRHWTVRYLVVDTGNWLTSRQVLISPYTLTGVNKEEQYITVNLTKKQIEESPSLNLDKPVSRQFEDSFHGYYGYPEYWVGSYMWGIYPDIVRDREKWKAFTQNDKAWDPNLRSTQEVSGHHIQAADGEIGHVEDFIIDEETWAIRYLIIDTKNWWSGKEVLVSPQWIDHISWNESKVFVNLTCETIKQSPEFTEWSLLTRTYENRLYQHYKRQGYWVDESVSQTICQ
ncbi:PRC-barrel domain-containing protein [uncultured Desulfobacter sp.]|uniref:PRC-barrel domain-containing protein n=1 Tax=uncultured Desulfobacter sp. TaxID=240139 RepID=UPI002AAC46FD|nr:PRC-barrel domain-containing protein [uncultured Desulfobacter sp.]